MALGRIAWERYREDYQPTILWSYGLARIPTSRITSLAGFISVISKIVKDRNGDFLVYRGHEDRSFDAVPSALRQAEWTENEGTMLRSLLASHPDEFERDGTTFEKLVRAQHYGLPTRLLDVTKNPLVALYFACAPTERAADGEVILFSPSPKQQKFFDSDTVACLSNLSLLSHQKTVGLLENFLKIRDDLSDKYPDDEEIFQRKLVARFNTLDDALRLSHLVQIERPGFSPRIHPIDLCNVVYVEARKLHKRLQAQDGAFLLFGLTHRSDEFQFQEGLEVREIYISHDAKSELRKELSLLGIDDSTLFPEIDHAASAVRKRFGKPGP